MPEWKKNIFVRVVNRRMQEEGKTAEEILAEYPALTDEEKSEIIAALQDKTATENDLGHTEEECQRILGEEVEEETEEE